MAQPTPTPGLGPKSPRAKAARALLSHRLADVRHARDALDGKLSPDGVHDLRVSTRRLRAALKLFRSLGALAPLEAEVKQLQDALGEVRDVHVQAEWLSQSDREPRKKKEQAKAKRTGFTPLRSSLEAGLGAREKRLRRELGRWDKHTVPALLKETKRLEGPGRYGGKRVRKQLRRRLRQLTRLMDAYADAPDALTAHEMRKTVKKLRYEAELFRPARRRKMESLLEALVPLQEVLGELHDTDVRLGLLEGFTTGGTPPQRTAARGLLKKVGEERKVRAAHTDRELQRWHEERLARGLRQLLD